MQRKYGTLMPFGTEIPANANLNTVDYIKVGNYYCSQNVNAATLTNSPTTSAFMMQVYSPLSTTIDNESTGTWVYRFRVLQVYTGARYTQYIYSNGTAGNFTYGDWYLTVESEADGIVGSTTKPVYLNNGRITEGSTYAGGTKVTLNGTAKGASTASFYAPTAAGTAGQILKSTAGAPTWDSITNKAATLTSGSLVTVATIAGTDITVKLPAASDSVAGATIVYPAAKCTTFTSDSGTVTPAAVKKAVEIFGVLNSGDTISGNLVFSNPDATGQSQHPNLTWNAIGANTPYIGYASDQSDGTFVLGSIKGTNYASGLAIGGGSGNLLWKGNKVLTTADAYTLPTASSSTLGGVKIGTGIGISSGVISNSGVRSIATGTTNGTISVNTNGTTANVAVKGLGSNAYTSTAYLPLSGGIMTGSLKFKLTDTAKGTTPSTAGYKSIAYCDGNGTDLANRFSMIEASISTNNTSAITMTAYEPIASSTNSVNIYVRYEADGTHKAGTTSQFYGAVWNDYAEYRAPKDKQIFKPGTCVVEVGDDTLIVSTERMQAGALIVSDTFGFAIGETEECTTPIATSGRVLAYTFEPRESYLPGDPVCSGPNGTVSKMTEQEVMMYPHKMIGTVSAIPSYTHWGSGNVEVDGRIWIQIR